MLMVLFVKKKSDLWGLTNIHNILDSTETLVISTKIG